MIYNYTNLNINNIMIVKRRYEIIINSKNEKDLELYPG
jgi:hypothetical protein